MPTLDNPYGYATPTGISLGRLAQAFMSGPSRYEVEQRQAATEAARALAAERRQNVERGARKMAAPGRISRLFNQAVTGELPPNTLAPGEMGPPTQMSRGDYVRSIVPQVYQEGLNAELKPDDLGAIAFQMMKLGGASDADIAAAYGKPLGVNDAVSIGDREAVAARNNKNKIAEIFATPVTTGAGAVTTFALDDPRGPRVLGRDTDATAQGRIVNDLAAGKEVPTLAQAVVGAMDKAPNPAAPAKGTTGIRNWIAPGPNGTTIQGRTLDGLKDMTTGEPLPSVAQVFTGQLNAANADDLRPTVKGETQQKQIDLGVYRIYSDEMRKMLRENPGAIGTRGNIARVAESVLGQTRDLFGAENPVAQVLQGYLDSLAGQTVGSDGVEMNTDIQGPAAIGELLPFIAAAAITGQSGRSLSNEDREIVARAVGSPADWTATGSKLEARLAQLDRIVGLLAEKYQGIAPIPGGGPVASPASPSTAPVVKWGRRADGTLGPIGQ